MKPVHIVILILAGALGGAGIMKVAQMVRPTVHSGTVAHAQIPASVPAVSVEPAVAAEPAVTTPAVEPALGPEPESIPQRAKPSPMPIMARREMPRPPRIHPVSPYYSVAPVVPDPGPQTGAAVPTPSPTMAPPLVSTEPENATPASPSASVAPAPQPHQVTLNAGLLLPARLVDGLSSERNVPGDVFLATLDQELVVDGFVIAERGARVEGKVVAADRAGRGRGGAALAVALMRLHTSDGQAVAIQTDDYFRHAENPQDRDAAKIGGDVLPMHAKPAELASETRVVFRLRAAVALTEQLR